MMNDFVVSARKYRPQTFDSVVGQSHITTTLKNAFKQNHLAQAFLFCGPRGVGKTTCARILAKTINCFHPTEEVEACGKCESCKSFDENHSFNIHELDAASNNSVDDIRNLVEQVRYTPQVGKKSVYIIDEVHMLSQSAFNAFLKTLEEPPAHATFILATTEKHKIIPTILSRCQIFDFKRIMVEDIASHLAKIAKEEGIDADPDALHIIGQKADGALRDSLSIFDRIVSFSNHKITYQDTIENLNILDYDYYFKVVDMMLDNSIHKLLILFDDILKKGFDSHNFIIGLAEHFRNLLVCQNEQSIQLLEVGDAIKSKYKEQALTASSELLLEALQTIQHCDTHYKLSKNQRLHTEICLMQLASINSSSGVKKKLKPRIIASTIFKADDASLNSSIAPNKNASPKKDIPKPQQEGISVSESALSYKKPKEAYTSSNTASSSSKKKVTTNPKGAINDFGFSIHNIPNKPEKISTPQETEDLDKLDVDAKKIEFTIDELKVHWLAFAENLTQPSDLPVHSILKSILPTIHDDFSLTLELHSKTQETEFEKIKPQLIPYLRKQLQNYHITIKTIVNKEMKNTTPYTAEEKYNHMLKKNKDLAALKQLLNLELGH